MNLFNDKESVIDLTLPQKEAITMFLCVFLAKERLPAKQLEITSLLVTKYAEYIHNGVKEPYASTLLFSTEVRKEIYEELKISAAQFNNAFKPLLEKGILALEDGKYFINPALVPSKRLVFNFNVSAGKG
jgi:hypothetical protein